MLLPMFAIRFHILSHPSFVARFPIPPASLPSRLFLACSWLAVPLWGIEEDGEGLIPSSEIIAYTTRLFEESETILQPFSDGQLNEGLLFLVSRSGYMREIRENRVPLSDRLRCIQAMSILFERCFALRLSPDHSHSEDSNPLHSVCWAWWDVLPLHGLVRSLSSVSPRLSQVVSFQRFSLNAQASLRCKPLQRRDAWRKGMFSVCGDGVRIRRRLFPRRAATAGRVRELQMLLSQAL